MWASALYLASTTAPCAPSATPLPMRTKGQRPKARARASRAAPHAKPARAAAAGRPTAASIAGRLPCRSAPHRCGTCSPFRAVGWLLLSSPAMCTACPRLWWSAAVPIAPLAQPQKLRQAERRVVQRRAPWTQRHMLQRLQNRRPCPRQQQQQQQQQQPQQLRRRLLASAVPARRTRIRSLRRLPLPPPTAKPCQQLPPPQLLRLDMPRPRWRARARRQPAAKAAPRQALPPPRPQPVLSPRGPARTSFAVRLQGPPSLSVSSPRLHFSLLRTR